MISERCKKKLIFLLSATKVSPENFTICIGHNNDAIHYFSLSSEIFTQFLGIAALYTVQHSRLGSYSFLILLKIAFLFATTEIQITPETIFHKFILRKTVFTLVKRTFGLIITMATKISNFD